MYGYLDENDDVIATSTSTMTLQEAQAQNRDIVAVIENVPSELVYKGFKTTYSLDYHRKTSGDGSNISHYTLQQSQVSAPLTDDRNPLLDMDGRLDLPAMTIKTVPSLGDKSTRGLGHQDIPGDKDTVVKTFTENSSGEWDSQQIKFEFNENRIITFGELVTNGKHDKMLLTEVELYFNDSLNSDVEVQLGKQYDYYLIADGIKEKKIEAQGRYLPTANLYDSSFDTDKVKLRITIWQPDGCSGFDWGFNLNADIINS